MDLNTENILHIIGFLILAFMIYFFRCRCLDGRERGQGPRRGGCGCGQGPRRGGCGCCPRCRGQGCGCCPRCRKH